MLIFCEECGKRYSFPPEKIDAGSGQFRCRECGFLMTAHMDFQEIAVENTGTLTPDAASLDCDKRNCLCGNPEFEKRS